ncbi:MAG TPA: hypothetical protein VL282_01115 [Tepidisphaeraceae bacterium]|jgi:hypothetical protein|nr:hypothetical protein [Tepidisphaeraceae bacterium]
MNFRTFFTRLVLPLCGLAVASSTCAQTTKSISAPSGAFEVQEWAIFIADPNQPRANAINVFKTTLPEDANSRRVNDDDNDQKSPCPSGVIRFLGQPQDVDKSLVDVLMTITGGDFIGNWPKAKKQPNRLLWDNLAITIDPTGLFQVGEKHWFKQLRAGDSFYLKKDRGTERFLLYDCEFNFQVPIKISSSTDAGVDLVNISATALHDVTVYKPQGDAWRVGSIDEIKGAEGAKKPPAPATRSAGPASRPTTEAAFTAAPPSAPSTKSTTRVATSGPKPTSAPTTSVSAQITYAGEPAKSASEAVNGWKEKLAAAGLAPTDFDVITQILAKHALDPKRLTLVYRMDPSEMDRIMPLEIVPQPKKITRVGLMIVRNIDPAIMQEIDQLITQLGDEEWSKRESAEKRLKELGLAAKPKLEQAVKNKDLEIVYRAERLMQVFAKPPGQ